MEHQEQQHETPTTEKKKRVSFWSPEEMITPQIIHTEPDHPNLNHHQSVIEGPQNSDIQNPYAQSYGDDSESPKFKTEEYRSSSVDSMSSPLKKPKREVDSSKLFKCPSCAYSFNRRDHLTRHSLVHTKLKPYHCTFCSKDFTRNDHLRRHQQRVHSEEAASFLSDLTQRFICQECKAIFSSSGHLRAHIENKHHIDYSDFITHTDDPLRKNSTAGTAFIIVDGKKRPFCQLCNKSFSKKDHLTRHMTSLHSPYAPSTPTFNSFSTSSSSSPLQIQSYDCQMCGKRFSRSEFLRRHLEDAHSYAGQMEILNHLNPNNSFNGSENGGHNNMFVPPPPHMIHNSIGFFGFENSLVTPKKNLVPKEHKCTLCNKNFSRKGYLSRHMKTLHNVGAAGSSDDGGLAETNREDSFSENSGRDSFDENSGRDTFDENSGRGPFDENSGQKSFDESSGRRLYEENSGQKSFAESNGRGSIDENSGRRPFNENSGQKSFAESSGRGSFEENSGQKSFAESNGRESYNKNNSDEAFTENN